MKRETDRQTEQKNWELYIHLLSVLFAYQYSCLVNHIVRYLNLSIQTTCINLKYTYQHLTLYTTLYYPSSLFSYSFFDGGGRELIFFCVSESKGVEQRQPHLQCCNMTDNRKQSRHYYCYSLVYFYIYFFGRGTGVLSKG
jgi:hypothetical protein